MNRKQSTVQLLQQVSESNLEAVTMKCLSHIQEDVQTHTQTCERTHGGRISSHYDPTGYTTRSHKCAKITYITDKLFNTPCRGPGNAKASPESCFANVHMRLECCAHNSVRTSLEALQSKQPAKINVIGCRKSDTNILHNAIWIAIASNSLCSVPHHLIPSSISNSYQTAHRFNFSGLFSITSKNQ